MVLNRRNVVLAIIAAFIAWATSAFYIPSLRWTPFALLLSVLGTIVVFLWLVLTTSRGTRYGEVEPRKLTRVASLSWTKNQDAWEEEKAAIQSQGEYRRPIIFAEAAKFSKALDGLIDLLLQDYVTSWYSLISPRPSFKNEIDRSIRSAVLTIVARAAGRDLVVIGLSRILPIITNHFSDFYIAERAVRGKNLDYSVTEGEELDAAISKRFGNGSLHSVAALPAADTLSAQQEHVRAIIVKLLPLMLPSNMTSSKAVSIVTREIVTCAVLTPLLRLLQEPDTWNQLIVNIAGPMLQDRKTVRKVRAALDEHAPSSPKGVRPSHFVRLRPYDNERQFEKFIRAIRQITTLSDARRCRSELMSQIRKDSALSGQDAVYLRRLETGRQVLDQKITSLSAKDNDRSRPPLKNNSESFQRKRQANLRDLLADAAGLSYFMEYMDRLKLIRLIQFWLVVDGIRGPLEGDTDELPPSFSETDRMDIGQMYEAYLSQPELQAMDSAVTAAKQYLKAGSSATNAQYSEARRAVLRTQTQTFERMRKEQFETFKRSDLYFKWLAVEGNPMPMVQSTSPLSPTSPSPVHRSASATRRPQLSAVSKDSELRRAVLSSADLKSRLGEPPSRRSLDDMGSRPSLFDDEDEEHTARSVSSLQSGDADIESDREQEAAAQAVSAVQEAIDDIVDQEGEDRKSLFADLSNRRSAEIERPPISNRNSTRPNISSLGLVGGPSNRGVFVDDLFGAEAQKFAEDERQDSDGPDISDEDGIQEAAPGDLGLTEAIRLLDTDIDRLNSQKNIVEQLKGKAELTNNTAELRILHKSAQSLQREIKRKEMQKQQYIVQESDNSLYGRARILIKSVMVGKEDDGREFALYVVEVHREAGDTPAATWAVTRRYSQFHELHKRLRARFPAVRMIDFPRRQALFTLQKDFLERRRATLEKYLQSLLLVPAICRSRELRAFLSQSAIASADPASPSADAKDFVTRIYNSVSDGVEEFIGNIPVLDSLSVAGQNLISAASQAHDVDALDPTTQDPATAATAEAELNAYETKDAEPFVKPICDLFLELFELDKGNSWLRGRAIVVVLHQLLGGTIERKVREVADSGLEDDSLVGYVNTLKAVMWPNGKKAQAVPRTAAQKARSKKEAALLLDVLLSDLAGNVVGRSKARGAGRKVIALLNNERLNTHLVLLLFEEILRIFFAEVM